MVTTIIVLNLNSCNGGRLTISHRQIIIDCNQIIIYIYMCIESFSFVLTLKRALQIKIINNPITHISGSFTKMKDLILEV